VLQPLGTGLSVHDRVWALSQFSGVAESSDLKLSASDLVRTMHGFPRRTVTKMLNVALTSPPPGLLGIILDYLLPTTLLTSLVGRDGELVSLEGAIVTDTRVSSTLGDCDVVEPTALTPRQPAAHSIDTI
jgi:hypothetical protein